ncbi:hypothetical protein RJ640_024136 [Escallonia rubra]|uniref:RING-type E3 ubiquitin transferase n=1 Tax=Escallonia rubra TaxID=112253 RepID=A0AA88UP07_9ASTE|nr:hypothetical protein RJ640_024136 [Escallonia rubra]
MERNFMRIAQHPNETITEYEERFSRISRFAPHVEPMVEDDLKDDDERYKPAWGYELDSEDEAKELVSEYDCESNDETTLDDEEILNRTLKGVGTVFMMPETYDHEEEMISLSNNIISQSESIEEETPGSTITHWRCLKSGGIAKILGIMRFLSLVGNSFGCSASGERLVSAARDGDLQEAKALLEYNPRLARYSTFGVRNSPLHYSAAQGHHEIVSLLLESGVDINLRNYRGQTALMQACQYGHWEVVQTLVLFKANIHKADYLNGGTALHLAALNGHSRCIRILLADYIPSMPDFCSLLRRRLIEEEYSSEFDESSALDQVINKAADGGITALHMAALNGHVESMQLLLDLGASVVEVTVEDGTTIDLIGAGSTPLHYAACGGNAHCCQMLIARGASLTSENANGDVEGGRREGARSDWTWAAGVDLQRDGAMRKEREVRLGLFSSANKTIQSMTGMVTDRLGKMGFSRC